MSDKIIKITDQNFDELVIKAEKLVIVDFWADDNGAGRWSLVQRLDQFDFGHHHVQGQVPGVGGDHIDFLRRPGKADTQRVGKPGEGAVIITSALAQPVHRAIEGDQRRHDDVGRHGAAGWFGMAGAIEAGKQLVIGIPGEKFHAAQPIDHARKGDDLAHGLQLRREPLRGRFIIQPHIESDDAGIGDAAGERRGDGLERQAMSERIERGDEIATPLPGDRAQTDLVGGWAVVAHDCVLACEGGDGTASVVCWKIL